MKEKITIIVCLILVTVLQVSVLPVLFSDRSVPSILLMVVVFFSSRRGLDRGIVLAIILGLMLDFLSFWPIGTNVLIMVISAYIAGSVSKRFLVYEGTGSYFLVAVMLIGAIIAEQAMLFLISQISKHILRENDIWPVSWGMSIEIMMKTFWSLVMLAILFPILKKIDRLFFGPARNIYLTRQ